MYSFKEKNKIYNELQNIAYAEADLDLLQKVCPAHPIITKANRNPTRYANEVLFALLGNQSRESIRLNRRESEQVKSEKNGNNNSGGSDTNPGGGDNPDTPKGTAADNPPTDTGNDNAKVENEILTVDAIMDKLPPNSFEVEAQITENQVLLEQEQKAREEAEARADDAEERVEEAEAEAQELQEQLDAETEARREVEAALEEEKKSLQKASKATSTKKKTSTPKSTGRTSKAKMSKQQQ